MNMKSARKVVFLALVLGFWLGYLGSIGSVNAIDYDISCENGRLIKNGTMTVNGNDYTFFQNISCPYGCNPERLECNDPYDKEIVRADMSMSLYGILFFMALASLIVSVIRKQILFSIFAIVLFSVLSFQSLSFNVILSGTPLASLISIFVYLNWMLIFIAFIVTLIGMTAYLKSRSEKK